jgi:hypothetical protein
MRENDSQKQAIKRKLNQINGAESVIYWSDVSSEIIFILPDGSKSNLNSNNSTSGKFITIMVIK